MNSTTNPKGQAMKSTANTATHVTAYKVAAMANARLTQLGLPANIPPQMCYNYVRAGRIPSVIVNGQRVIARKVALAWIRKHVKGAQQRAADQAALDADSALADVPA